MKLECKEEALNVESSDGFQEMEFGIRTCDVGFIMQLLRNDMYKYPIDAICREIASNSRDANREVGKGNVPLNISIMKNPFLDSEFSISFSDIGPGISPDRMQNIFLNYGASTKRDTDEQTGGFGLGAKTPFAYTNTFCVETIFDCKKYVYVALVKSGNKGRMYLMNEEECFDETGTTISVPIKKEDIERFEHAAYRATFFWNPRPIYSNFTSLREVNHYEEILKTEDFALIAEYKKQKSIDFVRNSNIVVLMDGIPYEIDNPDAGTNSLNSAIKALDSSNISVLVLCYVKMGEVTISPNRETLQYNDKTLTKIRECLKGVSETLWASGQEIARRTDTVMDRYVFMSFLMKSYVDTSKMMKFRPFNKFTEAELYLAYLGHRFSKTIQKKFDLSIKGVDVCSDFSEVFPGMHLFTIAKRGFGYKSRFRMEPTSVKFDFFDQLLFFMDTGRNANKDKAFYETYKREMLVISPIDFFYKYNDLSPAQKKDCRELYLNTLKSLKKFPEYGLGHYRLYSSLKFPKKSRERNREFRVFPLRFYEDKAMSCVSVKEVKDGQLIFNRRNPLKIEDIIYVPLGDLRKLKEFQSDTTLNLFKVFYLLKNKKMPSIAYINGRDISHLKGAHTIYEIINGVSEKDMKILANTVTLFSSRYHLDFFHTIKDMEFISKRYSSAIKEINKIQGGVFFLRRYDGIITHKLTEEMKKRSNIDKSLQIMKEIQEKFMLLKGCCYESKEKKHRQEYIRLFEKKMIEEGEIV